MAGTTEEAPDDITHFWRGKREVIFVYHKLHIFRLSKRSRIGYD